jgi:hypothetical protein
MWKSCEIFIKQIQNKHYQCFAIVNIVYLFSTLEMFHEKFAQN